MVLGKDALGGHGRHDGHLQQLGELTQLVPGLRPQHAMPDVQHRPTGIDEQPRRGGHVLRIARRAIAACRRVLECGVVDLGARDVAGKL